jgi:lipopolysaccharide/colanic/teichoic acid biosynthesis glycosyltransferase
MHCLILLFVDLALIAASTVVAIVLCSAETVLIATSAPYFLFTTAAAIPLLMIFGLNKTVWRFTSLNDCLSVAAAVLAIVLFAIASDFAFDRLQGISRSLPVMQGLLMLYVLGGVRAAIRLRHSFRRRARRRGRPNNTSRESVLLVGLGSIADLFLYCASENGHEHFQIAGILSNAARHRGRSLRSRKILGPPEAIEEILHDLSVHGVRVDRIVLAVPINELSKEAQTALLYIEASGRIRVDRLSTRYGLSELTSSATTTAEIAFQETTRTSRLPDFDGAELRPGSYLRWKRVIDAVGALICIICLAPLMMLVAIVVMFDVGHPPIFWQQRPGALGRPIRILKFRTMGPARDRNGRALCDAERVSKVGTFLRRLRLDELPQVYNVLLGHMSLVGPRPLLPVDQPSSLAARLRLRPGLTGWAQIKGGRHLSIEDKAALDLWYIENASFALDMAILANTFRTILFGERVDSKAINDAWQALGHIRSTDSA